jgi:hypothetical protein
VQAEEEIFYPALRDVSRGVGEAREEHNQVRTLIGRVQGRDPASPEFLRGIEDLKKAVLHHVAEEEGALFADAARLGEPELDRLGRDLAERKETLRTSLLQRGKRAVKQAAQKIA